MSETVLITGASSGIGLELAKLFAADGSRLILTARRADELNRLAEQLREEHGVEVVVFPEDLTDLAAPTRLFQAVKDAGLEVDVLVNNAGFGSLGWFWQLPLERQLAMIQLNVTALTHLTWLFLQPMRERRRGQILNVASTAAFVPGPHMSVYYASKAFVLSLSEGLTGERGNSGVYVTCLCPGPTQTEFANISGMALSWLFTAAIPAERVARAGYRGLRRKKTIVVPGLLNKFSTFLPRVMPRFVSRFIVSRLQTIPRSPEAWGQ